MTDTATLLDLNRVSDYECKIIGDGLTPETAFRPAIADVIDPKTGNRAYSWSGSIPTGKDGKPIVTTCTVKAAGDPLLVSGSLDVVLTASADVI